MSDWNEEQAKHKALKRGIVEQRPVTPHKAKKIDKPWVVWSKPWWTGMKRDYRVGKHATREAAQAWIDKQARSYWVSRLNQSPRALEEARERATRLASLYYIKGP